MNGIVWSKHKPNFIHPAKQPQYKHTPLGCMFVLRLFNKLSSNTEFQILTEINLQEVEANNVLFE